MEVAQSPAAAAGEVEQKAQGSEIGCCDICFCLGSSWVSHCCVTMHSILSCSASPKRFQFHVFGHDLSPDDQSVLSVTVAAYGAALRVYRIDESHFDGMEMPEGSHFGIENLFRLVIPELLPADIRYVLYLDCDVMATGELAELFPLDWCGEAMAAGVVDLLVTLSHVKALALSVDHYINSGVLVINVEAWRREMVGDQAIDWLRRNYRKARFVDQDALNVLLEGRLHYLPEGWNRPAGDGAWLEPGSAPRDDVRLVHFAGTQKPWHYRFRHPLKMEYYRYLSMTPFADTPPVGRSPGRVLREIRRTIQFVLYHPLTIRWLFNLDAMRTRVLYNDQNWPTP